MTVAEAQVLEGETTSMHLIIKTQISKPTGECPPFAHPNRLAFAAFRPYFLTRVPFLQLQKLGGLRTNTPAADALASLVEHREVTRHWIMTSQWVSVSPAEALGRDAMLWLAAAIPPCVVYFASYFGGRGSVLDSSLTLCDANRYLTLYNVANPDHTLIWGNLVLARDRKRPSEPSRPPGTPFSIFLCIKNF